MGKVRKFVRLRPDERLHLVRAALLLLGVRLGLAIAPFGKIERATRRLFRETSAARHELVPRERLAWAVRLAGRTIPGAQCLAQAIVLKALLKRHGYPACIRMGFSKDGGDKIEGHAWVESQGQVVMFGAPTLSRFGH